MINISSPVSYYVNNCCSKMLYPSILQNSEKEGEECGELSKTKPSHGSKFGRTTVQPRRLSFLNLAVQGISVDSIPSDFISINMANDVAFAAFNGAMVYNTLVNKALAACDLNVAHNADILAALATRDAIIAAADAVYNTAKARNANVGMAYVTHTAEIAAAFSRCDTVIACNTDVAAALAVLKKESQSVFQPGDRVCLRSDKSLGPVVIREILGTQCLVGKGIWLDMGKLRHEKFDITCEQADADIETLPPNTFVKKRGFPVLPSSSAKKGETIYYVKP